VADYPGAGQRAWVSADVPAGARKGAEPTRVELTEAMALVSENPQMSGVQRLAVGDHDAAGVSVDFLGMTWHIRPGHANDDFLKTASAATLAATGGGFPRRILLGEPEKI